ncbi:DUF1840 domain-containing protein [Brackiella oedipodis]|uniref:DUF1840 domain-containing protein n=1 Tax=Brackiella oedipodis TaxID=124225 RepID=UPI00048C5D69|nr:DUF1840 domain-containing protein [Brackiella oedipodis]
MIVTFSSKNSADIVMLDKHALEIFNIMGRNYSEVPSEGVITVAQIPEAIANIEAASAEEKPQDESYAAHDQREEELDESNADKHPIAEHVGVSRRSWPLLQMLEVAKTHGDDILFSCDQGY